MKVLLIKPNYKIHINTPPLGLGYIASALRKVGHNVEILDCMLGKLSVPETVKRVVESDYDAIGITVMSPSHNIVKALVEGIKKEDNLPIFLGGPHITALPDFVLSDIPADVAVLGEGEITTVELMKCFCGKLNLESVEGIAYRNSAGDIKINLPRELIKDLDEIPFPSWDLMPPLQYKSTPVLSSVEKQPIAQIMTSRGCPYKCTYCASHITWGQKWRKRSPENVVDEIEWLIKDFEVKELHLNDDNFTLSKNYAASICEEILRRNIKITWQCPNGIRIDHLDKELLILMKKAGCHTVAFGIESGNQKILDNVKKSLNLSLVFDVINSAHKVGMTTFGFFIFGLPGETKETMKQTVSYAKKLPLDRAWFFILAPMPGSELFPYYLKEVPLHKINWSNLNTYTGVMKVNALTPKDLEKAQQKATLMFYVRPKVLWNLGKKIRISNIQTLLRWVENRAMS